MLQMGKEKLKAVKGQTWEREPLFGRLLTFLVDLRSHSCREDKDVIDSFSGNMIE